VGAKSWFAGTLGAPKFRRWAAYRKGLQNGHVEILQFDDNNSSRIVFGSNNENLKAISDYLDIRINSRGGEVTIQGDADKVKLALDTLNQLFDLAQKKHMVGPDDCVRAVQVLESAPDASLAKIYSDPVIITTTSKKPIMPKTVAQKEYVAALRDNDLVFSVGPAGTGKTYLAMAMAVAALKRKEYKRILLTRPAVEAGERLGFLPGDIEEKVNPYLRPLYDALYDMVDIEKAQYWMQNQIVEVAPLAFMRGRTLNDSFIILDEAQNTTPEQMKMFLTRMGFGSRAVVTGDITQIDLPRETQSGLIQAMRILNNIEGIAISTFSDKDVVRHSLVQKIVRAYEKLGRD